MAPRDGHGHGGHGHDPHEAPWSMAIPLIVLAVGSVVAGYVGVPHALGGSNEIESFLEPSFEASLSAPVADRRGRRRSAIQTGLDAGRAASGRTGRAGSRTRLRPPTRRPS